MANIAMKRRTIVRDISWLSFNGRVLQEAADTSVPLRERIRFLGIFSNNMDEFFRVRVATLKRMIEFGSKSKINMHLELAPEKILDEIQSIVIEQQGEFHNIWESIRQELELCAPRLLRHATEKPSYTAGIQYEFDHLVTKASRFLLPYLKPEAETFEHPPTAHLETNLPRDVQAEELADALRFHDNRYAWVGEQLRRTMVRFRWDAVALAEIRDLNRHRTGTKTCPLVPVGFYAAIDQIPTGTDDTDVLYTKLRELSETGRLCSERAARILQANAPEYVYFTVLGTQYSFEHITTADKFLYEAELRTGTGAHYRYARHLHDMLSLWYEQFPVTKGLVLEGSAEPE